MYLPPGSASFPSLGPEKDPLMALILHYYMPARILYGLVNQLRGAFKDAGDDTFDQFQIARTQLGPLTVLWKATLVPLCEGFQKLGCRDPDIERLAAIAMPHFRKLAKAKASYTAMPRFKHAVVSEQSVEHREGETWSLADRLQHALDDYFWDHLVLLGYPCRRRRSGWFRRSAERGGSA